MRNTAGPVLAWVFCALLVLSLYPASPAPALAASENQSFTVPESQVNDIFDIANEEYKTGNFENAARLYEGLLGGTGPKTADVFYNLGNTYFKMHKYGKAIASYQRALRVAPREQDLIANLNYVRSLSKDKIDRPKSTEMLREILFFHYELNRLESEMIFICAYFASALFGTVALFKKAGFLRLLSIGALALMLIFGASTLTHIYRSINPASAVVTADEASVRTGPGDNYLVSFDIHDGAELDIRKRADGWYRVELPDGRRGWIRDSQVEII